MSTAVGSKRSQNDAESEPSTSSGTSRGPRCKKGCKCRQCLGMPPVGPSLDTLWANLHPGILCILQMQRMNKREYIGHYSRVYSFLTAIDLPDENDPSGRISSLKNGFLTSGYRGIALYANLRGLLSEHLGDIFQKVSVYHSDALLQHYCARWKDYRFSSQVISGICEYMDRFHLKYEMEQQSQQICSVYGTCLLHWKDHLLKPLEPQVMRALLDMYAADRNGEVINSQLLRGIIDNFVELGVATHERDAGLKVYQTVFEEKFLDETRAYYVWESNLFLQENSVCDYIIKVHTRLAEEQERATKYLNESTRPPLNRVLEEALIIHHNNIFDAEFTSFLTHEKIAELKIMDGILRRIPSRVLDLHRLLHTHIHTHAGGAIARDAEQLVNDPRAFVLLLLEQYDHYLKIVKGAFEGDLEYSNAMDRALEALINTNAVTVLGKGSQKVSELLARYCDILLKKSPKNPDDSELDEALNRVMIIFRYVQDKDVFQKYYGRMLSKRLVWGLSASDDLEAAMISKLKTLCGFEYTAKLQRMFQDIAIGKDLNEAFKHSFEQRVQGGAKGLEFTVQVLSNGAWPFSEKINLSLPAELERPLTVFGEFYRAKHAQRTLRWLYCVSRGELMTTCFPTRHILQVSAYQAAMLLLFNEMDAVSMGQLSKLVNCDLAFLAQVVLPFVKLDILRVAGKTAAQVEETDLTEEETEVMLNLTFKSKKMRLKLDQPLRAEQKQEEEATARHIDADRKMTIQAAIVRVMKMRKTIKHQPLIAEILTMLASHFKPSVPVIKKCIEILIEKEYMKRDEEDQTLYSYIA